MESGKTPEFTGLEVGLPATESLLCHQRDRLHAWTMVFFQFIIPDAMGEMTPATLLTNMGGLVSVLTLWGYCYAGKTHYSLRREFFQ